MTIEEKKTWLGRYKVGHLRLRQLAEQRARAKSFGEKVTIRSDGAASGGGKSDRVQLAVERIAQIDAEVADILRGMPGWERDATEAICALENADHRRVMRYYYIECLSWADVAELSGYNPRHVMRLHKSILANMKTCHHMSP